VHLSRRVHPAVAGSRDFVVAMIVTLKRWLGRQLYLLAQRRPWFPAGSIHADSHHGVAQIVKLSGVKAE
jgi:hypothetical protein